MDKFKSLLADIRFWIVFFFTVRLIGITNAPLEAGHNWRQALTNMISRNLYENDLNLLYPTVDIAGAQTGIIGSEFPFFNFLNVLFYYVFGYSHWAGRLINLIVTSIGLYFFYKLIKGIANKQTAFNATLILTVSIWFAFGRKVMPDTFSASLVIISLYYGYRYLKEGNNWHLLVFFIISALGLLCKIPSLAIFSAIGAVIFIKEIPNNRKIMFYAVASVSAGIALFWFFYWVPYLTETYKFELFWPKGILEGLKEIKPLVPELLERFYFTSLYSFVAFAFFLAGFYFIAKKKDKNLFIGVGITTIIFMIFVIKTGAVFPVHNYYVIPFTPIMALVAGYALSQIPAKFQYAILAVIVIEGVANQQHDLFIKDELKYRLELEAIMDENVPKSDLIIINGGKSPQDIYFAHRKGWTVTDQQIQNPVFVDSLVNLGAKFLVLDLTHGDRNYDRFPVVYADENYLVFDLDGRQ